MKMVLMSESETRDLLKYFLEAGQLKVIRNSGWCCKEGRKNPEKIAVKLLFHDMHEALLKKTDSGDWWKGLKEDVSKLKY
ncbi:MAG: hypothetical protein ACP5O3_03370 [Candidatus Micrarchaeia archaeon]